MCSSASISLIALPGVSGMIHVGSQSKFIPPYVVEVDKLGQAIAVPLVDGQKDKGREGVIRLSGCYAYDLATWRLRMHIRNGKGNLWTKAANYHSTTPHLSAAYRMDLMRKAAIISGQNGWIRVLSLTISGFAY